MNLSSSNLYADCSRKSKDHENHWVFLVLQSDMVSLAVIAVQFGLSDNFKQIVKRELCQHDIRRKVPTLFGHVLRHGSYERVSEDLNWWLDHSTTIKNPRLLTTYKTCAGVQKGYKNQSSI